MVPRIVAVLFFLLYSDAVYAQQDGGYTQAIVGSIFGTLAIVLLIIGIILLLRKWKKKQKETGSPPVQGYDNPLVIADNDNKQDKKASFNIVHENSALNDSSPNNAGNGIVSAPEDSQVFTVLLDQKQNPTNGFDVAHDSDGDIIVTNIRDSGPADGKLKTGDAIDSITVFFDNMPYEDAVGLLSKAAPYKVAVTALHKENENQPRTREQNGIEGAVTMYPKLETEDLKGKSEESPLRAPENIYNTVMKRPVKEDKLKKNSDAKGADTSEEKSSIMAPNETYKDSQEKGSISSDSSSNVSCSDDDVTIIQPDTEKNAIPDTENNSLIDEKKESDDGKVSNKDNIAEIEFPERISISSSNSLKSEYFDMQLSVDGNAKATSTNKPEEEVASEISDVLEHVETDRSVDAKSDEENEVKEPEEPKVESDTEVVVVSSVAYSEESGVPSSTPTLTPRKSRDDIVFTSGWRKAVKLLDLIKANLIEEDTVKKLEFGELEEEDVARGLQRYLRGTEPLAGIQFMETGAKMSLYDAWNNQIVRRGTAVGLLEAQAATGSIINPYNGERMNVEDATKSGLIDRQLASVLIRAERAVLGFKSRLSKKPLSLFEAMEQKLIVENHGIRLLEAQVATGGIIDPYANHRLPVEVAYERGLFDEKLNKILEDPSDDTRGFFDPNTSENLTYADLLQRCITDEETSLKLLPIYKDKQKKGYWKK